MTVTVPLDFGPAYLMAYIGLSVSLWSKEGRGGEGGERSE